MRPDDKAEQKQIKWACVTVHPSLPSKSAQVAGARAWGAHPDWFAGMDISSTYVDDVSSVGRTTRWDGKLPMRDALITALSIQPGPHNQVFFKTPLCIGFSEKHAADTLAKIFAQSALVFVQSEAALYRGDDDLTELLDAVARDAKAATQRRYRAKKSN